MIVVKIAVDPSPPPQCYLTDTMRLNALFVVIMKDIIHISFESPLLLYKTFIKKTYASNIFKLKLLIC